jgi:Ca-activated chloride channel family protein
MYLLWLVPMLVGFYFWAAKRKQRILHRFAQKDLLPQLSASVNIRIQRLKNVLTVAAVGLILFSFMRPQWGFHWQQVKRKGLDIIIAVDTSKSMLAGDVKPNRLERAKLAIKDFIRHLKADRIGLVAFAGNAFLQCPLTVDYAGFCLSLDDLNVNIIPRPGTNLSSAIQQALRAYEGGLKKYKVLILITDGENHESDPIKAAELAKKEGVKIFCIGIGSPQGELISLVDEQGHKTFLKDRQGNIVKTRLNESILQKIALTTGGSYVRAAATEFGLDLIYQRRLSKMEKRQLQTKMAKQYEERFQIPLFLAFLLLMADFFTKENRRV